MSQILFEKLSLYLNLHPDFIDRSIVDELKEEYTLTDKDAFSLLLAGALDIDAGGSLYRMYFPHMINHLDENVYVSDPYYKNISIPTKKVGSWEFRQLEYKPYEAFVCNDPVILEDKVIPQIGFFDTEFRYPCVMQNGREWMLITPNEIETMKAAVNAAKGRVLTYGLGMGYYAYMASRKPEVDMVTVVELDPRVIELFKTYILPQFPHKDKIEIIEADAFEHIKSIQGYDLVFCDIWHDPSDGVEAYLRFKEYESRYPDTKFMYWIEKTLRLYI